MELSRDDLRAVAAYAAACARPVLALFERDRPGDPRPRVAIEAAEAFAAGGERTKALRDAAWAAQKAAIEARDTGFAAATEAARAALAAAGAAFLHPLPKATQVKHILGSAAHAVRAIEIDDPTAAGELMARIVALADSRVAAVLSRYPTAPAGGGRIGALTRELDAAVRPRTSAAVDADAGSNGAAR